MKAADVRFCMGSSSKILTRKTALHFSFLALRIPLLISHRFAAATATPCPSHARSRGQAGSGRPEYDTKTTLFTGLRAKHAQIDWDTRYFRGSQVLPLTRGTKRLR